MEAIRKNGDHGVDIGGFDSGGGIHAVGWKLRIGDLLVFGVWKQRTWSDDEQESEMEGCESDRKERSHAVHCWAVPSGKYLASGYRWAVLRGIEELRTTLS